MHLEILMDSWDEKKIKNETFRNESQLWKAKWYLEKCTDLNVYIRKAKAEKNHPTQEVKNEQTNPKENKTKTS